MKSSFLFLLGSLIVIFAATPRASAGTLAPQIRFVVTDVLGQAVSSEPVALPDQIQIRVEDLTPDSVVTLKMSMGQNQSAAQFQADGSGVVDTLKQAPVTGSYQGIDADGLIWSMQPVTTPLARPGFDLFLEVLDSGGAVLSSSTLRREFPVRGITSEDLNSHGFLGRIFLPAGPGPFPTLIVLGGGEGGMNGSSYLAAFYASYGYAALAVAYFGLPGLPNGVDKIPMEYFKNSIDWLKAQPFTQGQRIGITGGSRGAEAALAIASTYNEFSAVVADVGNALPVSGYDFATGQEISPWTFQGRDLPFQKNLLFGQETYRLHPNGIRAFEFKSTRSWSILEDVNAIEAAILPVEQINAPILFNTADDDALWPSTALSQVAFERRRLKGVGAQDEFDAYKDVGHVLGSPPGLPAPETYFLFPGTQDYWELGGSAQSNARAQRESTRKTLIFLARHLK